jgi:NAD+ synthase (glutamine-hydrolysing)
VARSGQFDEATSATLRSVIGTPISPELVPANAEGKMQATEDAIGPYELQDFNLYYITRFGLRPSKVAFLAWHAWRDKARGDWPALVDEHDRRSYSLGEIRKWLEVFVHRFFELSQFKRSALPNGPKVVAGGSLSPRGDWRAPSDGNSRLWLQELRENVPE